MCIRTGEMRIRFWIIDLRKLAILGQIWPKKIKTLKGRRIMVVVVSDNTETAPEH